MLRRGDIVWGFLFVGAGAFITSRGTQELFVAATNARPYLMGFLKFALLATMGEFLSIRITRKRYERPKALAAKVIIWGVIGLLIVLMFQFFSAGVSDAAAKGYLPKAEGLWGAFLAAFLTSAMMNLTFGPVFMACHRISDRWLDLVSDARRSGGPIPRIGDVVGIIDWTAFIRFVVAKTIPFFWIPAHTITFMLPGEFRIVAAAFLSIVLGAILSFAKTRNEYSLQKTRATGRL